MVTFSWNFDVIVLTPVTGGGNWAAASPATLANTSAFLNMMSSEPMAFGKRPKIDKKKSRK